LGALGSLNARNIVGIILQLVFVMFIGLALLDFFT
jgi:hypothetical protein